MPKSDDCEMNDKWDQLRKDVESGKVPVFHKATFLELLDERDKLAREALMREGLIAGLQIDRERLERELTAGTKLNAALTASNVCQRRAIDVLKEGIEAHHSQWEDDNTPAVCESSACKALVQAKRILKGEDS